MADFHGRQLSVMIMADCGQVVRDTHGPLDTWLLTKNGPRISPTVRGLARRGLLNTRVSNRAVLTQKGRALLEKRLGGGA
jgi:hypothetical protein